MGFTIPLKKYNSARDLPGSSLHINKALKVCFCLSCIFQNFILTNRLYSSYCSGTMMTNVPSAADNLEHHEAQNEAKIYFKLELWTWDETLQEQVVKSLVQPSAGSSTTAGRGRQDMGRWWPVTRMAPFNSVGAEEPAYRLWTSHRHNA